MLQGTPVATHIGIKMYNFYRKTTYKQLTSNKFMQVHSQTWSKKVAAYKRLHAPLLCTG